MTRERKTPRFGGDWTPSQQRIIEEIKRVAQSLGGLGRLSQREFDENHDLGGVTTAGELFGSWNEAVVAAGLEPNPSHGREGEQHFTDDELLSEIIRVHRELGREPSERKMASRANYSLAPYRDRWGTLATAREAAYKRYGRPD